MNNDVILQICNRLQNTLAAEKDAACSALMAELEDRQNKAVSQLLLQLQAASSGSAAGDMQGTGMAIIAPKSAATIDVSNAPPKPLEPKASQDVNQKMAKHATAPHLKGGFGSSQVHHDGDDTVFLRIAKNAKFEALVMALILISIMTIAMDVQIKGLHVGYMFNFGSISTSPEESMPWLTTGIEVLDFAIGICFCGEIVIKVLAFKMPFFYSISNCMDAAIVGIWLMDVASANMSGEFSPFLIRIIRLMRVMRLLRLAGQIENLESLFLLVESIKSSWSVCFWSTVLIMVIQMGLAIFLNQALSIYIEDSTVPMANRKDIFQYFGTMTYAMVTMFELTFGNFVIVTRKLQPISEWYAALIIAYKVLVGFAALRIISGIFMAETLRVANNNDTIMVMQKKRKQFETRQKMTKLFKAADESGDGHVSEEEFLTLFEGETVKTWLSAMDMDVGDPAKFFRELAGNDDTITAEEMIQGVARLKGSAKCIDMIHLMRDHTGLIEEHKSMYSLVRQMDTKMTKLSAPKSLQQLQPISSATASGAANVAAADAPVASNNNNNNNNGARGAIIAKPREQEGDPRMQRTVRHKEGTPIAPCAGCFQAAPPSYPP